LGTSFARVLKSSAIASPSSGLRRRASQFAHVGENGLINVWKKHRGNARLAEAVKVLAGDPRATMLAYGRMSRRCGKAGCGRKLTHPDSIERGMSRQHAAELGLL
jgi:hypothetical protein